MTTVAERCLKALKDNDLSFEKVWGRKTSANGRATRQLREGAALTVEIVLDVVKAVPSLSLQWLLLGEGQEYVDSDLMKILEETKNNLRNAQELLSAFKGQVESQKKVIDLQERLLSK